MGIFNTIVSDVEFGLGLLSSFGQKVDVVGIYSQAPAGQVANSPSFPQASIPIVNSILGNSNVAPSPGQMFAFARPVKATVRETSKIMEHPAETGIILADHHIINPIEIDLSLIINAKNYAATYAQIRQAFINATQLIVKTRTGTYSNMVIADMPHQEEPDMYNAITLALRLKQIIYFTPGSNTVQSNYQPVNAANNNTISSGLQQAAALGGSLTTAATAVASYASTARKFF